MIKIINHTDRRTSLNEDIIFHTINIIADEHSYSIYSIEINFITDKKIHELNNLILNHDYPTDIITLDYTQDNFIKSELFISLDTIESNAIDFNTNFNIELARVILHGILHIVGYNDKTDEEKREMKKMEDYYLNLNVPRGTL
jgi:rRNA maturation RNase YbeY